jgi:hypothetical protein
MPFVSKNEYKIFTFGKTYIVKDAYINKVKDIDSYRYFIWSNRPYIWIPILIISAVLSGIISYLFLNDFNYLKSLTIWLSIGIYLMLSIVFYIKIRLTILGEKKRKG